MKKMPDDLPKKIQAERRQHKRLKKNFILSYSDKARPEQKFEVTQLKNISKGGMCFVTRQRFEPSTKMVIELKTPFLVGSAYLEGTVLESHEKAKNMIYETRLQFDTFDPKAEFLLAKLIEFFADGESNNYG